MSYTKHEWVNNETITAAKMNNIEDGIEEAAQSGGGGGAQTVIVYFPNSSIGHQVVGDFDAALADVKVGKPILAYTAEIYNESGTGFSAFAFSPLGVSYDSTYPDRIDLLITAGVGYRWTASGVVYFD